VKLLLMEFAAVIENPLLVVRESQHLHLNI